MADNKKELKYYRTELTGLSVVVGDPEEGQVAPQTVRFVPYNYQTDFEVVTRGYLATDNEVAIKKLDNDPNVTSITKEDFDKYTNEENDKISKAAY